ncbi:MAG: hypothetical protein QXN04_07375, partial [Pyrobaculum sp.]
KYGEAQGERAAARYFLKTTPATIKKHSGLKISKGPQRLNLFYSREGGDVGEKAISSTYLGAS